MSLNPNSTHLFCSELYQTHQENELTHKYIWVFFGYQSIKQSSSEVFLGCRKILKTHQSPNNCCSVTSVVHKIFLSQLISR